MELGCCDLVPAAHRKPDSADQVKASHDQSRRHEVLLPPIVLPILKERGIEFDLRPEFAKHAVLERIVPRDSPSQSARVGSRKSDPERALHIEVAKPFAVSNRRRNHRMQRAI